MSGQEILLGNEAMGRALVEAGASVVCSYPGTPASEILESVVRFSTSLGASLHAEWSVNEAVAYETALAAAYTGKRAAVAMKQVGLNVAADPFMRSAYTGVKGGFVLIAADDPGPQSSQTEQDSRFFALFAKIPVFNPADPREAAGMITRAFELSESHGIPIMVRPTTRVCHARQNLPPAGSVRPAPRAEFVRDPASFVATPQFMPELHRRLNARIAAIAADESFAPRIAPGDGSFPGRCVVASGAAWATAVDVLDDLGLAGRIDLVKVDLPHPLYRPFVEGLKDSHARVLVLEETYPLIERQLMHPGAAGRLSGAVPDFGELTPDVVARILSAFLDLPAPATAKAPTARGRRPALCPGCPHRPSLYAAKRVFPRGIFPGDIGCYTLGMNFGAVDTCHCMGAGVSMAGGFYQAYALDDPETPTVVAAIGDSTFFHAGIPPLINAVQHRARIIVLVLDNSTTAMTGAQPTPQTGITADGSPAPVVRIENIVQACGVGFVREVDPYRLPEMRALLKEADAWCRSANGGPAVIIARHPCVLHHRGKFEQPVYSMAVGTECTGCRHCTEKFECPGLVFDEEAGVAFIDVAVCTGCGVCADVCPTGAISTGEPRR